MRDLKGTTILSAVLATALATAAAAFPQQAPPAPSTATTAPSAERIAVRAELVQLLESDSVVRIDYHATSMEGAGALAGATVDAYLDGVLADGFDVTRASRYGTAVINGLNDHKINYRNKSPFTPAIVIDSREEAVALGEVLHLLASLVDRIGAHDTVPVSIRATVGALLDDIVVETGNPTPIVQQYVTQLHDIAKRPTAQLERYLRLVKQ
jgi:hypothetical protein